jgi:hypothetical protein
MTPAFDEGPRIGAEGLAAGLDRPLKARGKKWSGFTEAFFRTDGADGPVIIFHHIPKTAGTSLRHFLRENLPPSERELRYPRHGADWYGDWYAGLPQGKRAAICCVMSHSANYMLDLLDRPVDALCLVREPVDRVMSIYHHQRKVLKRRGQDRRSPHWNLGLGEIFERYGGSSPVLPPGLVVLFNGQSRSLLAPYWDTRELPLSPAPPPNADLWRERLFTLVDERYRVGVQSRFSEFVRQLATRYGWRPIVRRAKVHRRRPPTSSLSPELQATIREYNWLDDELHRHCAVRQAARG